MKKNLFVVVSALILSLFSCASFSLKSQAETQKFRIVIDDSSETLGILREGSDEKTSILGLEKPPDGDRNVYSPEELEVYIGTVLRDLLQIDYAGQGRIEVVIGPLRQSYDTLREDWRSHGQKGSYVIANFITGWAFDLNIRITSNQLLLWSWKKNIKIPFDEVGSPVPLNALGSPGFSASKGEASFNTSKVQESMTNQYIEMAIAIAIEEASLNESKVEESKTNRYIEKALMEMVNKLEQKLVQ